MKKEIKIALAGNPNSGKTSIFNNLTGSHQHVGNWPGVTVEKKEGYFFYENYKVNVVDLPGIYSLSASTIDEKIARDFLLDEKPDLVVCIVDSSNLERNFYLVTQLLEMKQKIVIDLNMIDIAEAKGLKIDENKLSLILNLPVVKTVASKNKGTDLLKKAIITAYQNKKISDFKINYNKKIEEALKRIIPLLEENNVEEDKRWISLKLLEGDQHIIHRIKEKYKIHNIEEKILAEVTRIEKETGEDIITLMVDNRYGYIKGVLNEILQKSFKRKISWEVSDRIDRIILNRFLGIPIFLLIMYATFQLVFTVGGPAAEVIDTFFSWLGTEAGEILKKAGASDMLISFFVDGVIGGVGSVLVFLPNILLLFLVISFLEDTGYMARAAFVMDKLMHTLGLHGKSFIPMILGFGCNVPAIMATRTLESEKDRILTILVNPLISCSARLPIYVLFTSVFFTKHQGLVVFSLYLLGIVLAIVVARIFKNIFFKEEVAPLIMELPPYRLPQFKSVLIQMWLRAKVFLIKAGTIIFVTVVLIWFLGSLPPGVEYASEKSIIGKIGKFFAPIFKPAGFGFWQAAVALVFGILAKEVVVGTLGTLFGGEEGLSQILPHYFTPLSAYAFMVMSLIYVPCIATIAVIKRETNWKWTLLAIGYSLILGWIMAVLIFQIGNLLG